MTGNDTFVFESHIQTLTNKTLTSPTINTGTISLGSNLIIGAHSLVFEGSTVDAYETFITVTDPTADRTITLPDATDTLVGKATTDTLTNKSIDSNNNTITNIVNADVKSDAAISVSKTALVDGTGLTLTGDTLTIDSTVATLTGTQTLTNKTLTSPVLNTGVSGTAILDEDNMTSDSATQLATQQSIKAYTDATSTAMAIALG